MPLNREPEAPRLEACRQGMTVFDVNGDELGTIALIGPPHSGDERTVNRELIEQYDRPPDLPFPAPGSGGGVLGPTGTSVPAGFVDRSPARVAPAEPHVSAERAQELLHSGYIKIDSKGFFHRDRYAGADQIARVEGNTLHLTAAQDDLAARELTK